MIQTLYEIGQAIHDDPNYEGYFQPWGNPFPGREKEARVIVVEVEAGLFKKVTIETFRTSHLKQYLYRIGSTKGRATNCVPTVPYIDSKTSLKKIEQSLTKYGHDFIPMEELEKVKATLSQTELSNDHSYLLTFRIDGKYLGDIPEMVKLFEENAYKGFFEKNYSGLKESKASNYRCALTGKDSTVYGFVDSLGFTVNDDAFMRNGFDQNNSYKMFPVSPEAIKTLNGVTSLVFTNEFSHTFSGKTKYLILPKFISANNEIIKETFELFRKKQALNLYTEKDKHGAKGFINNAEKIIDEIVTDENLHNQNILYDILFYEDKQAQLSLYLQLTDIRPSRLKSIMEKKNKIEKFYERITNFQERKKQYTFYLNLAKIKDFLLTEQGKKTLPHPFFFKLTEAIFYGNKVEKKIFIRFLLNKFRNAFKQLHENQFGLQKSVKEGFVLLQFLEHLHVFTNQNNIVMQQAEKQVKQDALGFIDQHPDFFATDYKKGAFLFGCLVTRLMYNQPGNAFLKDLNDLKIDKGLIEKKFPKLIAKLRQYGHEFRELEQAAANYLTDQSKIDKDEISFAVSLGLIMQKEFDIRNKKIKEVETELGVKQEIVES